MYQTIAALRRAGLITVRETARDERRPERTVYEITDKGRRTLQEWMRTVLSTPARDFPDFPAALSLAAAIAPEEVRSLLETRIRALETRLAALEKPVPNLPRLFLLESEYAAALVRAEIAWLRGVAADLRSRRLTWSESWLRRVAAELAAKPIQPERARSPRRTRTRRYVTVWPLLRSIRALGGRRESDAVCHPRHVLGGQHRPDLRAVVHHRVSPPAPAPEASVSIRPGCSEDMGGRGDGFR